MLMLMPASTPASFPVYRLPLRQLILVLLLLLLFATASTLAFANEARLKVELSGVRGDLRSNVQSHLGILAASDRQRRAGLSEKAVRRLHRAAKGEIEAALKPFGFYSPNITSDLQLVDNVWRASYNVDPGKQTTLRNVTIEIEGEGKEQSELRRLVERTTLAPGRRLNHPEFDTLRDRLRNTAYSLGYLDARYARSRLEVYPEKQQADVILVLDTGPRFYFGEVTIEQNILSAVFIDKFVTIEPGEPFEPRRLTNLQLALSDSPYFAQAEITIQKEQAQNQRVPVFVATTPSKSQRYETSLGYGTDTGPRGGAGVLWRRINQHGHQFRTDTRLSLIQSTLVSQYKIPVGDVGSEYLDFTADAARLNINDVDATSYSVGSSLNQNRWGGRRRASLALRHEVFSFGDNPSQSATLLIPGMEYSRIIADDLLFTRRGYSAKVVVSGALEQAFSDATFLQAKASLRHISPLGENGRLLLRTEYGATATDSFNSLPPSQRFFNGGAQDVRGYGFQELSARDAQGNIVGGRYLGTASVEVDYLVYGNVGLALFVDTGNASDSPDINWKTGAGVGFRYKTPVGMFRLDFAHPFDDPDSSFAFHISFGPDLQ